MADPSYAIFSPPAGADMRFLLNAIEQGRDRTAAARTTRVLVDLLALERQPQDIESLLLSHHAGMNLTGLDRIAILIARRSGTGEQVARRLGTNMRVFESRGDAIAWLEAP